MSAAPNADPFGDEAGRPMRGWVKIALTVSICALLLAALFGLNHVGWFSAVTVPPPKAVKEQVRDTGFTYPAEITPAAFHPAEPDVTRKAIVPIPVARQPSGGQQDTVTPLNSPILGLGGGAAREAGPRALADAKGDEETTDGPLSVSLRAVKLEGTKVAELSNPTFTIGQGRVIACKQVTGFSSQHPGGVVAKIDEDVRGETGGVILLDKGAQMFGVSQHAMVQGTDTAFVLWQNITTIPLYDRRGLPHQYRVSVNSAATSETGETGLPGDIDHHYGSKIPALIGISLLGAAPSALSAAASNGQNNGGTALNFINAGGQGGQSAADSWLGRILNEPDNLRRLQGMPCGVLLMRDLDLSGAYRLRTAAR